MGIAIRTGSPLSLSLAEGVWRQLAGQPLRPQDLAEVDKDFLPALLCIRDMTPHNKVRERGILYFNLLFENLISNWPSDILFIMRLRLSQKQTQSSFKKGPRRRRQLLQKLL